MAQAVEPATRASRARRRPGVAVLGVAALVSLTVLAACSEARDVADDRFEPATAGTLTVAAALPSPGFWDVDAEGAPTGGFEWGLAVALAERFDLALRVVDVPFERLVVGDLGGADLALAQIERTDEREEVLDLSVAYLDTSFAIVQPASAPDDDVVTDLFTARERSWAVVAGSREEELLDDVVRPDGGVRALPLEIDALDAVADGRAEAALVDLPSALILTADRPALATTARIVTDGQYVAALPDDSPNVELVDSALRAFASDGTLDDLEERWLLPAYSVDPDDVPVIRARS